MSKTQAALEHSFEQKRIAMEQKMNEEVNRVVKEREVL